MRGEKKVALETGARLKKRGEQSDGVKDREVPLETERRIPQEDGGGEKCCRGEGEWALNLPPQLDRNHSLQQCPAEIFDMEIHDCVNIWTQCRPNSYIIGNSPAAAFILSDSTFFVSIRLVLKLQAISNLFSCPLDIVSAS